jgi:hypothetical protein
MSRLPVTLPHNCIDFRRTLRRVVFAMQVSQGKFKSAFSEAPVFYSRDEHFSASAPTAA